MKDLQYLFLMICLILFFGGCGKGQPPAKKPIEKVKAAGVKEEKTAVEETRKVEPEQYVYDARNRRDPFLSLIEVTKKKPSKKKGASPFESYDIDEIRLLAIAWDKSNKYYALVMLPDKKTYTITEGMTIGLQGGRVEKITKDAVVFREFTKDYRGETKARDSILKLHKGEEG